MSWCTKRSYIAQPILKSKCSRNFFINTHITKRVLPIMSQLPSNKQQKLDGLAKMRGGVESSGWLAVRAQPWSKVAIEDDGCCRMEDNSLGLSLSYISFRLRILVWLGIKTHLNWVKYLLLWVYDMSNFLIKINNKYHISLKNVISYISSNTNES